MRELLPAATLPLKLKKEYGGGEVIIASVLPMLWPALHRADGSIIVGLQATVPGGDLSKAFAAAILAAQELPAGEAVTNLQVPADSPRLQDLLENEKAELKVEEDFQFWLDSTVERTAEIEQVLQQANESIMPSKAVKGLEHAYWVDAGAKEHLRWIRHEDEEQVIDAVARLHAKRQSHVGEGTRYVGSFRADGLTIPVWDLPKGYGVEGVEKEAVALKERFEEALAYTDELSVMERRARGGIVARQVTLR